ncbi:hypothetical protein [Occallatibacter savannae]|uniref:hypothetical protein n=1 Tax=Occallatibacter savannae TaxID=1002691 RepID=UPI000D68C08A|nr:hypothetical protein [Occallatibacter savannae]
MGQMIPFRYGGFWDVPRYILLRYRGKALLLESPFDEKLDEYPDDFTVYELPCATEWSAETRGDWIPKETRRTLIGYLPIGEVVFDPTMRERLDADCLNRFFSDDPDHRNQRF